MKAVRRVFAVLVGTVFVVAGLLKLMDPTGTGLIMEEYFKFFHLRFMVPSAKVCGTVLALFESLVGCALITGVWRRVTGIISGILLGIFTAVTFVLWLKNPEMECGCFGEAIHLTHLQTLVKNLILLVFWAIAFIPLRTAGKCLKIKYVSFSIAAISLLLFTLWSTLSIPMIDFTEYNPGTEISSMDSISGNDGGVFTFSDMNGDYRDSLAAQGNVLLLSAYDPEKLGDKALSDMRALVSDCFAAGIRPLILICGTPEYPGRIGEDPVLMSSCYFADRRMLLTLNRSNGGATLVRDGMVIDKWAVRALPSIEDVEAGCAGDPTESMIDRTTPGRLRFEGYTLFLFAIMLLL